MAVANPDPISEEKTDIPETESKIDNAMLTLPTSLYEAKKLLSTAINHVGLGMIYKSYRAHRSPNTASIFLFGKTGAGKSSTLNHLFGDNDLIPTSDKKSCTRDVIEYGCIMDSTHWKVEGLGLGFVDTPGYGDTDGVKQDARNLTTINEYIHTKYYKWTQFYPNIVLVVVNGSDNRMFGIESEFSQMLHVLSKLNIVDREHPNVVIAVTHALNLKKKRFIEKSQNIAKDCTVLSKLHLIFEAPVVFIENDDEDDELDKDGDWKILPDGTRQPLNLFQAMMNLMKKSGDEVGVEAIRMFFSSAKELKVELKHTTPQVKRDNKLIGSWMELIKANFNASQSEVYEILLDNSKSPGFTMNEPEIMVLAHNLKVVKLLMRSDIEGKKVEKVKQALRPYVLNNSEIQILCKVFKLKPIDHLKVDLLGLGHSRKGNQKKEKILDVSSEKFSYDTGIFVPQHFHTEQCNALSIDIEYKTEGGLSYLIRYLTSQPQTIQIKYTIRFLLFKVEAVDTAKLSLNAKFSKFLTEYLSSKCFNPTKISLDAFYGKFGTHCITGLHFGGSLTCFKSFSPTFDTSMEPKQSGNQERLIRHVREIRCHLESYFDYLMTNQNQANPPKYEMEDKIFDDLKKSNLSWRGGDKKFHSQTLGDLTPGIWNGWIDSLSENLILLDDYVKSTSLFDILSNSPDVATREHGKYFKPDGAIKPDLDDLYYYTAPDSMTGNQHSKFEFTNHIHTRVMASEASKSETYTCIIL